ncbi:ABC transporter permease [Parachryseolinea silvisoli]|uniref:ABC transporter permease n=1 Tax=Parachryseolinea silvisoli TaxID=2873601 RepID=UPI0022658861|nr:ABC transporter permease [Parachryseolinea silvisoli]MCD9017094.1 ABC transporter permease [Parachryseolinea silvisoli]
MIKNYLLVALRNMGKYKLFTIINIGGLALSLASFLFIFYYLYDELTYDRFHQRADRIYRLTQTFITPDNTQNLRFTHQKLGPYLQRNFPQVEQYVRLETMDGRVGKNKIKEKGITKTDPQVFDVFTYPLIEGNAHTALRQPHSIVLSKSLADKYFPHGFALGETLEIDGDSYTITGIMSDPPANSDKFISAFVYGGFDGEETSELSFLYDTYILLRSPGDAGFIQAQLPTAAEGLHKQAGQEVKMGYDMQALTSLHFFHGTEMDNPKGNKSYVYIFGAVALVLVVVAVFNFINLTTIRSLERAREVGIRKVTGAYRSQLIWQFLSESFVSVLSAAVLGILFINLLGVIFEIVSGKHIQFSNTTDRWIIGAALLFLILIAVAASLYPAIILSSFRPVKALKGRVMANQSIVQKVFTIGQFTLSAGLLVFLVAVILQMRFMGTYELGFSKKGILAIAAPPDTLVAKNLTYYTQAFLESGITQSISVGGFASNIGTTDPLASPLWLGKGADKRELIVPNIIVDKNYPALLHLQLKEGNSFDNNEQGTRRVLVNESFVKHAGWTDAIGQTVKTYAGEGAVVGVLKDYHFQSLHNKIEPLAIFEMDYKNPDVRYFYLKTSPDQLASIQVLWKKLFPDHPLEYFFLDEYFDAQYTSDKNLQVLFLYFTTLTIALSILGLLGLTYHHVERRTKELGIRKVHGASTASLITLLSTDFIRIVLADTTIGLSIGYVVADRWLANFAYHIPVDIALILIPGSIIIGIASFVVAFKAYRGAVANPVEILKCE